MHSSVSMGSLQCAPRPLEFLMRKQELQTRLEWNSQVGKEGENSICLHYWRTSEHKVWRLFLVIAVLRVFLRNIRSRAPRKDHRELALQFLLTGVWRPFHMYSHLLPPVYAENLPSEGYLNAANRKVVKHFSCSKDRKKNEPGFFLLLPIKLEHSY